MKQNNNFIKTFILLYFFISSSLFGASIIKEFNFPIYAFKSEIVNGYSFVSLKGCDLYLQDIGKPILPFANVNILIPPDAEITEIEVLDIKQTDMPGEFLLYPAQPPKPISYQGPIEFIEPDIETYNLSTEYPGKLTEIVPSGNKSGFRIGGIFLYPLQYIPKEKKLILYERIRIRISYEQGRYEVWPLTQSQKELFSADVRSLVCNPEDINRFSPPTRASENPDVDYIILTSQTLEPRFGPLVKWLRKTGIWADTFNTSWVYANYTGYDNAEKIRKFILDYFTNHGTKYVLLAGDIPIIPKRGTYSIVNTAPPTIDSFIPCDLYYFDLQWSWDGNGNHVYGDNWTISGKKDTVDLYYDVYGGRWPVETQAEIDTLMRKFFTYVKTPDTLYQKRILLPWGDLWGNDPASRQSQDTIANLSPTGWTDRYINKTMNTTEVRDSLNNGFGFCHLVGHGNEVGVYWTSTGPEMYLTSHTSQQTNYNKLVIANSMGCYPGCFDYSSGDCLAEEMLKARGSAIATIMNSRYGWGYSSGQIGPSELLDVRFYDHLFSSDSIRIASCHQSSKERYRNTALNDQVWRWCYYELNLFGEPQMMMWKDNPKKMVAKFNRQIGTGSQSFAVTCSSQGTPLAGALVCLWKGTEVYTKGTTASNGQVSFAINPTTPGYMYVTVTAKNKIPFEDSCNVIYTKDVGVTAIEVPTGTIESTGTAIVPRARVKNFGTNTETFNVTFRIIGTTYNQTRSKTLGAGIEDTVNFPSWIPARGTFQARCSTYLAGDAVSNNNVLYNSFTVQVKDVGVTAIEVPTGTIESTGTVIPRAKVKNFGSDSITFQVTFKIGGIYSSSRTKKLDAGIEDTVHFAPWSSPRGTYSVRCSTYVTGDVNHSNDTLSNSVTVIVNDVGVTAITSPPDTIYRGGLQPKATVKNYGTQPATFYTYFKIFDWLGNQVYLDSSLVSSLNPNASSTRTFKAFLFQVGKYQLRCSTALANDLNPINDVKLDSVVVLYIPAWVRKRDMPLGLSNKYVKAGGALTVGVGDKIYAFKGNNTNEFYVYDIAQDTWITLESIPYNPLYRKRVNRGAALAYNKHYNPDIIYAIKGNNTLEFWAYNVEQDTWIRKIDVPLSINNKKLKNGSCITFLKRGSNHYVYLLKANNTLEFYAYHCDGDSWIKTLQPAPAGINLKAFKTGSCIVTGKDNKLYVLKGGGKYNEFWCYDAALDSWTEKESLPRYDALLNKATKVKDGASLCFDGDSLIYAFKGGNRQSFWVYNINQNKWAEKETIPRGSLGKKVSSGGALAFADDKVFALKGNRTCEFWRFDPLLSLYNFQKMATSNLPTISQNLNNDNPVSLSKMVYSLTATKVQIYNSVGQLVYESEVLNDHSTITTKSLIPGVYFIKITDGKNNYSKKLIVK